MKVNKLIAFGCDKHSSAIIGTCALLIAGAAPASAYTPHWLRCDGQVVSTGADHGTKPASDVYIYDDDNRNLFKYFEDRGRDFIEPVTAYNDTEIRWGMEANGPERARWHGRIDRKTLALKADYVEPGSTMNWTEQCKPIAPLPAAVAATQTPGDATAATAPAR